MKTEFDEFDTYDSMIYSLKDEADFLDNCDFSNLSDSERHIIYMIVERINAIANRLVSDFENELNDLRNETGGQK